MFEEVYDLSKAHTKSCDTCAFLNNCPYEDKFQCIDVRSSYHDAESNSEDISQASKQDLFRG